MKNLLDKIKLDNLVVAIFGLLAIENTVRLAVEKPPVLDNIMLRVLSIICAVIAIASFGKDE